MKKKWGSGIMLLSVIVHLIGLFVSVISTVQISTYVSNSNIKGQITKNQLSWVYLCAVELIDGEKYCWPETETQKYLYFSI